MSHYRKALSVLLLCVIFGAMGFMSVGCAYRLGYADRQLPAGIKKVAIPVFENKTSYTGAETAYTNSLRAQFAKSKVAQVVDKNKADAIILGTITNVDVGRGGFLNANDADQRYTDDSNSVDELPRNTLLITDYRVIVTVDVQIKSLKDNSQLWRGQFQGERAYTAPQVRSADLNTSNALYNSDARAQAMADISMDVMSEAHDRMSENF